MTHQIAVAEVSSLSAGMVEKKGAAVPTAAAPDAVRRFEQLMFQPPGAASTNIHLMGPSSVATKRGMQLYLQHLSQRWEAGQTALDGMLERGHFTTTDLIKTQVQMINCALDVEVSSKCASIFESGVQTLVQRGGA